MIQLSVGKRVRALRKERGWTQKDLGRALGVDETRVSRIENDVWDLSLSTVDRLARAFGVRRSDLFSEIRTDEEPDEILARLLFEVKKLGSEGRKRLLRALESGLINPKWRCVGVTA